ncbi:MAG: hypothetical protein ABI645_11935 [Pseudomonadota bacterium]
MTRSTRPLWMSFYPLLLAAQMGAVLMDQSYAGVLRTQANEAYSRITSEAADLLLLLLMPVLLAGAISLWASNGRSRLLVCASLAVVSLNFALPVLASAMPGGMTSLDSAGPLLRLAVQLGALLFAVLAVREVTR